MRFAAVTFAVAIVLFAAGATSLLGAWAVSAACVLFLTAAVAGAVAMEERDRTTTADAAAEPAPTYLEVV